MDRVLLTAKGFIDFIGLSVERVTRNKTKNNLTVPNMGESDSTAFVGWLVKMPLAAGWKTNWGVGRPFGGCCNSPGKSCSPKTVVWRWRD